jgi:hypothetical protein
MTKMYTISLCKTKATYEVKLDKRKKINLKPLEDQFPVIISTPLLIIIKVLDEEVIVHNYGTIQFKNKLKDQVKVEEIAKIIYSKLKLKEKI